MKLFVEFKNLHHTANALAQAFACNAYIHISTSTCIHAHIEMIVKFDNRQMISRTKRRFCILVKQVIG